MNTERQIEDLEKVHAQIISDLKKDGLYNPYDGFEDKPDIYCINNNQHRVICWKFRAGKETLKTTYVASYDSNKGKWFFNNG